MCFDRNINGNRNVEFLECHYLLVQRSVKLTLIRRDIFFKWAEKLTRDLSEGLGQTAGHPVFYCIMPPTDCTSRLAFLASSYLAT